MTRICIICGESFTCSPTDKKVTCSKKCSIIRKKQSHSGISNKWSKSARAKKSESGQTPNLKKGTPAAQKSPVAGPFGTSHNALIWELKSPDGVVYKARNLNKFIMDNPDLFMGSTLTQARSGIQAIKKSMLRKTKRPVNSWKGWQLLSWEIPE